MRKYEFPYEVQSLADLPESFQGPAQQALRPDDPIQLILFLPRHSQTRRKDQYTVAPQALLFTTAGVVHVQEAAAPSRPPAVTYLRGADLLYAEHTLALLYGRLELAGVAAGQLARIVVEYNTVRQHLLQPALEQLLQLAYGPPAPERGEGDVPEALLASLSRQSYKLGAGLRLYALQPEEHLRGFVLQPRIVRSLGLGFERLIAPAALVALTDRAVLLLEENQLKGANYGWHITCCPLACVTGIETQPKAAWREVCVHLARNQVTSDQHLTLAAATAQSWETVWPALVRQRQN